MLIKIESNVFVYGYVLIFLFVARLKFINGLLIKYAKDCFLFPSNSLSPYLISLTGFVLNVPKSLSQRINKVPY